MTTGGEQQLRKKGRHTAGCRRGTVGGSSAQRRAKNSVCLSRASSWACGGVGGEGEALGAIEEAVALVGGCSHHQGEAEDFTEESTVLGSLGGC